MSVPQPTLAIVLHRVNYGEADRVVTLLTENYGRVSCFAKSVRKQGSKLAGGLELMMLSEVSFIPSKRPDGLATITSARMKEFYGDIVKDYEITQQTFRLLAIVDKAAEFEEDTSKLFLLTREMLNAIQERSVPTQVVIVWFVVRLSQLLGQGLALSQPLNADEFSGEEQYEFDSEQMGFMSVTGGQILPIDIKLLRLMSVTDTPKKLKNIVNITESSERLTTVAQFLQQQLANI